ncbi:MAG TPA: AMP-binding protein [Cytophagales bacterium]|nr:AMP-binding protein [Cytophagales bacterium]
MKKADVYNIIAESAQKWTNKPAITDEKESISFLKLHDEVEKLKELLLKSGLTEGAGLGIMAKNSSAFIIAVFAGLACGAVILPISHQIKAAELESFIKETKFHAIIDDKSGIIPPLEDTRELISNGYSLRYSFNSSKNTIAPHINNPAFIRFSSGTTGKSKGVIVSHESVFERIEAANKGLLLGENDNVLWVLPMAYHFIVSIVLYLKYGCTIVICNDFLAQSILDFSNKYKATMLYASPMHIRLLASDNSGKNLESLEKVISTSTSISTKICEAFKQRFNLNVSQAYGIIEIGLPIINLEKSNKHPESVGFALPDYEVEILNKDLEILPSEEVGLLAIKGPGMFDGYLDPPAKREDILQQGWFMTGDLATKSKDGRITVVGRKKSMINVSGNKVFPEEVEATIEMHPDVKICHVFGEEHILMGEIVKAEIVLQEGKIGNEEEIISFCRQRLSTYKVPQKIYFVDKINTTGSGKIKR